MNASILNGKHRGKERNTLDLELKNMYA